MKTISTQLEEIERLIPQYERANTSVSSAPVGWHLEHSLLVIENVCKALLISEQQNFKPGFKLIKHLVLFTGKIPRGKATAPRSVIPTAELNILHLQDHLQATRKLVTKLPLLEKNQYFDHPFFGHLNKKTTNKFLRIHTNHHLAIIRDILNARGTHP